MTIPSNCFQQHLHEAIQLNKERKPLYSKLTQGTSSKISFLLISSEKVALLWAKYIDARANTFQKKGIPIVYHDFVSMEHVPVFQSRVTKSQVVIKKFMPIDMAKIKHDFYRAYNQNSFDGICKAAQKVLSELNKQSSYYGMVRHLVESMLRIATLAPVYINQARELKTGSTQNLSWLMIRSHIWALSSGYYLDKLAAPIQAKGIPIIIQDVPSISII